MAQVQLVDAIIPAVYQTYGAVNSPELTAFVQSGVAVNDPIINANAIEGGNMVTIPFWKDLDPTVEPNYSNDNPASVSTPQKIGSGKFVARTSNMNQSWSAMDLVKELAGSNPMERIKSRTDTYWARQFQTRLLAITVGIFNNNVTNDGADMVSDISTQDGNNATDANLFGRKAFTSAVFTLGDHFGNIGAIAVHSLVYKRMVDNDDITFERPSTVDPNIPLEKQMVPKFLNKRVIIDDQMPILAGGVSGFRFISVLYGDAMFGYGTGNPLVPVEAFRNPDKGNGGGQETLYERKTWVLHPFGHQWNNDASVTAPGNSPTNADLKLAANRTRTIQRKNVPVAFLVTNG